MAEKYYSILTNRGKELEAQSSATGKPVIIKDFVVGDGNGQAVRPDPAQTKLVREVYRSAISALQVSPDQANQFFAQLVLPVAVGGFVVREVGLLTDAGELYSVANCAAIEKPENGVSVNLQFRLAVSETAAVELKVATGDGLFLRIDRNLGEIAENGPGAQKSAREAIDVVDATISRKGLVQLSNATDSTSEEMAATSKAVKAAYDLADGKYTAQDATTARKGIVQLSSATDSTSEVMAATPKAVKAVNDELAKVKNSLGTASGKDVVTSQTDTTAGRVLTVGYAGVGGTAPRTAVVGANSYDNIPAGLPSGFWTHAVDGGPYAHTITLLQDGGGKRDDRHLIIPSSYTDKIAIRWDSGTTKNYQYFYTDKNKPTAADVGAVPSGRKVNGHALDKDTNVTSQDIFNGQAIGLSTEDLDTLKTPGIYYQPANANTSAARHYPETNAGTLLVYKNAGVTQVYIVYNSSRTYTRSQYSTGAWTAWAKQYDTANKPTATDVGALPSNGNAVSATKLQTSRTIGGVAFDGTANINLPGVNTSGNQSTTGNAASATRLQTARTIAGVSFNGTANIAIPAGNVGAYTKAECDGRFQPKGNYTPTGTAYTKAESDARYGIVNGIRRGGQQVRNPTDAWFENWESPAGCVVTGIQMSGRSDGRKLGVYFRQMQYLNKQTGAWVNIGD
ncbi:phage tail-collar fiber domain-containing protein [Enterobacter hormaechei]|uniref:phage tail-collar fiber domain-containing protein n=1 Tax=Enterobacter hormaechei TaxID=158836 RepID=UPI00339C06B7